MKRYDNIPIQSRFDGKRVYKTTIYPVIPTSASDIQVVSREGDYLDTLAYKYYGQASLWWVIASANGLANGSFCIKPGTAIVIPSEI